MAAIELQSTQLRNDANLVGYYRLEGDATATVGPNGTSSGLTYATGNGMFGQGMQSNAAAGSGLSLSNNSAYNFTSGNFSINFWIYPVNHTENLTVFCRGLYGVDGYYLAQHDATTGLTFDFTTNSAARTYTKTNNNYALLNQWNMVTVVRESSDVRIYVNSTECTYETDGTHSDPTSSTRNFYFARYEQTGYENSNKIDDISIFSRVLNPGEISNLYSGAWGNPSVMIF